MTSSWKWDSPSGQTAKTCHPKAFIHDVNNVELRACVPETGLKGMTLHPIDTMGCNYLPMPLIPASGTWYKNILNWPNNICSYTTKLITGTSERISDYYLPLLFVVAILYCIYSWIPEQHKYFLLELTSIKSKCWAARISEKCGDLN